MNKLSIKIALLIGVLSFLISFGIGKYSNEVSSKQLEKNSGKSLLKLSKNIADTLDREMLERYKEIQFASTLYPMTSQNSSQKERRNFLEKIKNSYGHHEWIGYALPDGTVDSGTKGYLEGKNAKARPWHPAGLKGPYIGDVHDALLLAKLLPNTTGEAIYFSDIAFPVKNKNGKVLGTLCTHLSWQWTRDIIRSIEKEHGVDIFLLSKDDLILVGPNNSERKDISQVSKTISKYLDHAPKESYKTIDWNNNQFFVTAQTTSDGFEEYKGFNWKVVVREPIADAFLISNENSSRIIIASIIIGFIGAIIGIFFASKITAPINTLNQIVTKLTNKEKIIFESKVSNDEIGDLYNAIKNLYENLDQVSALNDNSQEKVNIALQVFDQSIEGIFITDKDNKTVLTNKTFENITGYTQKDMYGKNPSILSSEHSSDEFYKGLWKGLTSQGKWEGKITNKRKDGSLYDEYLRISTLKDNNGIVVNYVATFVGLQ